MSHYLCADCYDNLEDEAYCHCCYTARGRQIREMKEQIKKLQERIKELEAKEKANVGLRRNG